MIETAMYYFGTFQGKRKSDGASFWCVNLLRWNNRFNQYQFKAAYVDQPIYNKINGLGMAIGTAVSPVTDIDGNVLDLSKNENYKPLNLNQRVQR